MVDPVVLSACVGCDEPFAADCSPVVITTARCPLSPHVYVSAAHAPCQVSRDAAIDMLASTHVKSNIPVDWLSSAHRQHPLIVEQFKRLHSRWIYSCAGQSMKLFNAYTSMDEQQKFRLDQVGSSNLELPVASLPFEPFTMMVPLLMTVSNGGAYVTPTRAQLWVSPATLPFDEFRLLFTYTYACEFKASVVEARRLQESMASVRALLGSLGIVLPRTASNTVGRYWLQEARQNEYFIVAVVSPSDDALRLLYTSHVDKPAEGSQMSWFHWQQHTHAISKTQASICENVFMHVIRDVRASIKTSMGLTLLDTTPAYVPASVIYIDLQTRTPCIRYKFNSTSKDSWWVFPCEDQVEDCFPIMYDCDNEQLSMQNMRQSWYAFGAMPILYDTRRFRRVYSAFPLVRPPNFTPVGVRLSVTIQ